MRRFHLARFVDHSGVSGTGHVAAGVELPSGRVVLEWCVPDRPSSVVVWDSIEDVQTIHGHDGDTRIVWLDDPLG